MARALKSYFLIPYERNPHFCGRDLLLNTLYQRLLDTRQNEYNHRIALYGLGGIGKTQLAIEYAYRYHPQYSYIFWISAATRAKLLSGYVQIAVEVQCCEQAEKRSPNDVANDVIRWLSITERWLLIIDNLDDIKIVDGFLPHVGGQGHTLITTRNQNCDGIPAEGLEVDVMSAEEALSFLLLRAKMQAMGESAQHEGQKIVRELGYLPLAIEQAAAYIRMSQDILGYLKVYEKNQAAVLSWMPDCNRSYNFTVGTTWRLALTRLKSEFPSAISLISLLAFLNPDEIDVEFLRAGCDGLEPELRALLDDDFKLHQPLFALQTFSLIRIWDSGKKIGIHRLVQTVVKEELSPDRQTHFRKQILNLCLTAFPDLLKTTVTMEDCRPHFAQTMFCFDQTNDPGVESERHMLGQRLGIFLDVEGYALDNLRVWRLTSEIMAKVLGEVHGSTTRSTGNLARALTDMGQTKQAAELLSERVSRTQAILGFKDPFTILAMEQLGELYINLRQHSKAVELFQETSEICKKMFGFKNIITLYNISQLADSYRRLGQYEVSISLQEEVLKARTEMKGLTDSETLESLGSLLKAHCDMVKSNRSQRDIGQSASADGSDTISSRSAATDADINKYDNLLTEHHTAVETHVDMFGEEHPQSLAALSNLANAYSNVGNLSVALALRMRVLSCNSRVFGNENPETLYAMQRLAECYSSLRNERDAINWHQKALNGRAKALGAEHPATVRSMYAVAKLYQTMDQNRDALVLHQKALDSRGRLLGSDHPETLRSMYEVAVCYTGLSRYHESLTLLQKTLDLQKAALGEKHENTLWSLHQIGINYAFEGRYGPAIELFEKLLDTRIQTFGGEDLDALMSMHRLACTYADSGQPSKAVRLHENVLEIRTRICGSDAKDTLNSLGALADAHESLGQHQRALELRMRALDSCIQSRGRESPEAILMMRSLAWLYNDMGLSTKAREIFQQSIDICRRLFPEDHEQTLRCKHGLAYALNGLGCSSESASINEEILEIRLRELGEESEYALWSMYRLGAALVRLGDYKRAIELLSKGLDISKKLWGDANITMLDFMVALAGAYSVSGGHKVAIDLFSDAAVLYSKIYVDPEPSQTVYLKTEMGWAYLRAGQIDSAENLLDESWIASSAFDNEHLRRLELIYVQALIQLLRNREQDARAMVQYLLDATLRNLGPEHPETINASDLYGIICLMEGKIPEAVAVLRENQARSIKVHGAEHPVTATTSHSLAIAYLYQRNYEMATGILEDVLKYRQQVMGLEHYETLSSGRVMARVGSTQPLESGESLWKECLPIVFGRVVERWLL